MTQQRKKITFWGEDENDDSLVRAIIEGRKTVTVGPLQGYIKHGGGYEPGEQIEVWDLKKQLTCIIEITKVYPIKFGSVPEEVWRGETFNSAEAFRQCYIDFMPKLVLTDDFEFMTIHFTLAEVIVDGNEADHPSTAASQPA